MTTKYSIESLFDNDKLGSDTKTTDPYWLLQSIVKRASRVIEDDGKQRDSKIITEIMNWINDGMEEHLDIINGEEGLEGGNECRIGFGGFTEFSVLKECCDNIIYDLVADLRDKKKPLRKFTTLGKDLSRAEIFSYFAIMKSEDALETLNGLTPQDDQFIAIDAIVQAVDAVNLAERVFDKGSDPDEIEDQISLRRKTQNFRNTIKGGGHPLKEDAIKLFKKLRKEKPKISINMAGNTIRPMLDKIADEKGIKKLSDLNITSTVKGWLRDSENLEERKKRARYE